MFFDKKEQVDYILDLTYNHKIPTGWIHYPSNLFYECAIRNYNTYGIDPDGFLYKCWEIIGDKKYAVAKLTEQGGIQILNNTMLNRCLYASDPLDDIICKKCSYLPLCNGGCPFHRIKNEFEECSIENCTNYKGRLLDFFKIYIKLKRMGFYDRFKNKDNVEGI